MSSELTVGHASLHPHYHRQEEFVQALAEQNTDNLNTMLQRGVALRLVNMTDKLALIVIRQTPGFLRTDTVEKFDPKNVPLHSKIVTRFIEFEALSGRQTAIHHLVNAIFTDNPFGQTPLIWAVTLENVKLASLFQSRGCLRDGVDNEGNNPLMYAARNLSAMGLVTLLLRTNALSQTNTSGENVFSIASRFRNEEIYDKLFHYHVFRGTLSFSTKSYQEIKARPAKTDIEAHKAWRAIVKEYNGVHGIGSGHPFRLDFEEALELAYEEINRLRIPEDCDVRIAAMKTQCLKRILREKYSTLERKFTTQDMEDVLEQREKLEKEEITRAEYPYAECDPLSLDEALRDYYFDQPEVLEEGSIEGDEHEKVYSVHCYRMPGFDADDADYELLQQKVMKVFFSSRPPPQLTQPMPKRICLEKAHEAG